MMRSAILISCILFVGLSRLYAWQAPAINGLVGYWALNGDASDASGGGRHGTVVGATFVTDRFGNASGAASFDGIDDYINLGADFVFQLSEAYTISLWQFMPSGAKTSWSPFIGKNLNDNGYWMIHTGANITFYQDNYNSNYYIWNSGVGYGDELPYNTWLHIVLKSEPIDAQNIRLKIYVNGQFVKSASFDLSPRPINDFTIRYFGRANSDRFFEGSLDDIMVFNRSLTESEISGLYSLAPGGSEWLTSSSGLFYQEGNVSIGTSKSTFGSQEYKLSVNGNIRAKEVNLSLDSWSDFVFDHNYQLTTLPELESYIQEHNHLPEIPSTTEVLANGLMLGK